MKTIGQIIIAILTVILEGFVFATMWGWFIAGTFGLSLLSIAQGIGIAMTVRLITNQSNIAKERDMSFAEQVITEITSNVLILIIGFIVTLFI
jgi:hypothetical protein